MASGEFVQKPIVTALCLFMLVNAAVVADRNTARYQSAGHQAMGVMTRVPGADLDGRVYDTGSGGERDQPGQESRYYQRYSGGESGRIDPGHEERIDRYVRRDAEMIPDEENDHYRYRQNYQDRTAYFQPRRDTPPSSAGTGSLDGKQYRYHARTWQKRQPVYRKRVRKKRRYHARIKHRRKVAHRIKVHTKRRYHARIKHRRKVASRKKIHTERHYHAHSANREKPRRQYQPIQIRRSVLRRALRTPETGFPRINLGVHGILALSKQQCHRLLRKHGVRFTPLPFKYGVRYPVQLDSDIGGVFYRHTGNNSTFSIVDCRLAVSLLGWSHILRRHGIYEVLHMRTYSPGAVVRGTDKPSGHSWALAIDAALFRTDRYGTLDIQRHWTDRRKGISPCHRVRRVTDGQSLLRALVCDTARSRVFGMILTPHFNNDHHDHLHLEIRPRSYRLVLR